MDVINTGEARKNRLKALLRRNYVNNLLLLGVDNEKHVIGSSTVTVLRSNLRGIIGNFYYKEISKA